MVDWPFAAPHRPAWDHCLYHHGPDAEWLALLEPDEYLFATDGTDLATALADFRAWPGVGVARTIFAPAEGDAPAIRRAAADLVLALPPFLRATGLDRRATTATGRSPPVSAPSSSRPGPAPSSAATLSASVTMRPR